ncbi:hypothetical protein RHSIM_Rhsim07G0195200 [Rhododendron simsii]|uniref:Uncharacterized protein n=1 Tax=Rhododendron simsii TaxID=118357 RepID=A0A834GTX2_RHOSS|nr:hypothetical protein RHSIM_Rhsim07G0195200 [Rhododendron simsii]
MAKRKASKRPHTMTEAIQISLSEVVQEDPTPRPLEDIKPSQVTQPSQAPQPIQPPSNETGPVMYVNYDKPLLFHVIGNAYISILFSYVFYFRCSSRNKVCKDEQARCNILGSAYFAF